MGFQKILNPSRICCNFSNNSLLCLLRCQIKVYKVMVARCDLRVVRITANLKAIMESCGKHVQVLAKPNYLINRSSSDFRTS